MNDMTIEEYVASVDAKRKGERHITVRLTDMWTVLKYLDSRDMAHWHDAQAAMATMLSRPQKMDTLDKAYADLVEKARHYEDLCK